MNKGEIETIRIKTSGSLKWIPLTANAEKRRHDYKSAIASVLNAIDTVGYIKWPIRGLFVQAWTLVQQSGFQGEACSISVDGKIAHSCYHDISATYLFLASSRGPSMHVKGDKEKVYVGQDCKIEVSLIFETSTSTKDNFPHLPMWDDLKSDLEAYISPKLQLDCKTAGSDQRGKGILSSSKGKKLDSPTRSMSTPRPSTKVEFAD